MGWGRYLGTSLVIAAAYYAFTELGKSLLLKGPAGAFWPSAGLGIAVLYLGGLRWWPAILLGDLGSLLTDVINLGVPVGPALAEAAGDLGRTLVSVLVLQRLVGPRIAMDKLTHVGAVLVSVASGAVISATVAMLALLAAGLIHSPGLGMFWRSWWLGDVSGGLVILPLALAWTRPVDPLMRQRAFPEAAIVLAAVVGLSIFAISSDEPLTYLVFPALIWSALRLGPQGATLTIAVAVLIAVWITSNKLGAFVEHSDNGTALNLQLYITIAAVAMLCLAALVTERRNAGLALTASRARIVGAATEERRRIERDLHDGAQQQLVALRVKLGLAEDLIEQDPTSARQKISGLGSLIDEILAEIRSLAAGIYPSLLATSGLGEALRSLARQSLVPTSVEIEGLERCPAAVEEAVYFCCSEALQNAAKHAHGLTRVSMRVARNSDLYFEVRDDGAGFSVPRTLDGEGLTNMRERMEAVGGRLSIVSAPNVGTRVTGSVPL